MNFQDHRIETLENKLEEIQHEFEDYKERMRKRNDVTINGIPYRRGENLRSIYNTIAYHLGFNPAPMASFERLKKRNGNGPIVVTFESDLQVALFMKRYHDLAFWLRLNTIEGYGESNSNPRVYIYEHLATSQYNIHTQAMAYHRSGDIFRTYKKSGQVFVQLTRTSPGRSYQSVDELVSHVTGVVATPVQQMIIKKEEK